ncbi:MAG TPA: HAMP domain-containing sensor histidine kinase [Actinomycetota bacterium]|jgi:signal transduction histidine kinase
MLPDRWEWRFRRYWIDIAWAVFACLNLVAMLAFPTWETVPFHFIWVSVTVLYGFRVWKVRSTLWTLAAVIIATGMFIAIDVLHEKAPIEEMTEVPLMSAMFLAMVWHARRRLAMMEELRRISEENVALLQLERRFIQDASHELRTPIAVALGHTELIKRMSTEEPVVKDAGVAMDEMLRLRRLADRLLVLASVDHPGFLHTSTVDLALLVVETLRRWSTEDRRWSVGAVDEATVDADPDRLQLALDALIENAVKHTTPDDSIEISLRRRGQAAAVRVADTGTGIPPEALERIFDRFARADPARSRDGGGVGLGLSVVKAVAEAHGGSVDVRSSLGKGSTFSLRLPLAGTQPLPDRSAESGRSARPVVGQVPVG